MQADKSAKPNAATPPAIESSPAANSRELTNLGNGLEITARQSAAMLQALSSQLVSAFESVPGREIELANALKLQSDVLALSKDLESRAVGLAVSIRVTVKDAIKREETAQSGGEK